MADFGGDREPQIIEFGEWMPDLPALANPGALLAKNCMPELSSYRHFNGLAPFANAIEEMVVGSYWLRAPDGSIFNFAGTADKLWLFDGAMDFDDVSQAATSYSAATWDFTNFQRRVLATDGATAIQYFDVGVSTEFADLPDNPPIAQVIGVVRDFVMVGDYEVSGEREEGGFAWSGFNNSGLWTPSLATQAGRRRNRGNGGKVQRIVSGSRGIGFRQDDILGISYVGPPNIWQWDDITVLHGTDAPRSVCWTQDFVFYHSIEGFKRLNRRSMKIDDIGYAKVDQWFRNNSSAIDVVNMQGVVDRRNKLALWAFRSSGSAVTFDRVLVFNWAANRWAYAEINVELIGEFASAGYNLDTIGAVLGGDIDSASIPVDSDAYSGGAVSLLAFDDAHVASTFDGDPLTAEIDTKEIALPGHRTFVNGVVPIVEATTAPTITVAPLTRNLPTQTPSLGSFSTLSERSGQVDMRVDARYHRYRVKIANGFEHAKAIMLPLKTRGKR